MLLVNRQIIKEKIWSRYMPYIKPDNERKTTSIIEMASCELGVTPRTVSKILSGEGMSLKLLKKVMICYDISSEEIFINGEL